MDSEVLEVLLEQAEGPTLDFKRTQYRLDNEHYKGVFVKDILAMANTPRNEDAHLVLGVSKHRDGHHEIDGLAADNHPDDADLQSLVASRTNPAPTFHYEAIEYAGKSLGIITIPPAKGGPFLATWEPRNESFLRKNTVYFRRGSQNADANSEEIRRVTAWMAGHEPAPDARINHLSRWVEFKHASHDFDEDWQHVLVVGDSELPASTLASIGRVDWSAIFDFSTNGKLGALYTGVDTELRGSRSFHFLTLVDEVEFVPERTTYFFAAKGYEAAPSTLAKGAWRDWFRKYDAHLKAVFGRLARGGYQEPISISIVGLDADFTQSVLEAALLHFGGSATAVIGAKQLDEYETLAGKFNATVIALSLEDFCAGLRTDRSQHRQVSQEVRLPGADGEVPIPQDELLWLEEEVEIVHLDAGRETLDLGQARRNFLRGATISWTQLSMHCDVDRDATDPLVEQLLADLAARQTLRVNIFHWPGSGGTTIARRAAWEIHKKFPVLELKRVRGEETFSRLRAVFDYTRFPPLVLVDASQIALSDIDRLYTSCRSRQLPVIFLQEIGRREESLGVGTPTSDRSVYVSRSLSQGEAERFARVFGEAAPHRTSSLNVLANDPNDRLRNPFYFGLVAFESDFQGLEPYVAVRLGSSTEVQKKILVFLSLAYHYGQRSLPAQLFGSILAAGPTTPVRFTQLLSDPLMDLVVREGRLNWRPSHDLVAQEILESQLSGNASDRRLWRNNLGAWALSFIEMAASQEGTISDDLMDAIRRIFVLRDNEELLGSVTVSPSSYSRLLEDIPTNEGRLTVLRLLVELFPDEAHFWGHLGRLLSQTFKDYDEAIVALDHAIGIAEGDPVLHHMKGMALRHHVEDLIDAERRSGQPGTAEQQIKLLSDRAAGEFQHARDLSPDDEHGFIAHVQLCVRLIEYGTSIGGFSSVSDFLTTTGNEWYKERLDEAEQLLYRAERIREGQRQSRFFVGARASLDELYGDLTRVIRAWTRLLTRNDLYLPPIRRQLARVILKQADRDVRIDELHRIMGLMEQNLLLEPATEANLELWFRCARRVPGYSMDKAIDKVANWRAVSDSLDATFYLYVLHSLKAMDGSSISKLMAEDLAKECQQRAYGMRNRHYSLEWLGKGTGLQRLIESRRLGEWDEEFANPQLLTRLSGTIREIRPASGTIELPWGQKAFFSPTRRSGESFVPVRDLNKSVTLYLAFSYDGLRAWDPKSAEE